MKPIKYFLLIFISLSVSPAIAQLKIGVTGGAVLSTLIRDSNLNANQGMVGYLVGANARLNLGELGWFVESGVSYTLEGDNEQHLNFVKIPLMFGLDFGDDAAFYVTYNLAWQVGNQNNVQDFYNDFANILGLGVEVYLGDKFAVGPRLNYGLSNLVKDPAGAKNYNIKPFTLDLYLTYYLLKK